jgi:ribosome-associated toxin RatA of RatAB toxin-antitoxin module
MTHTTTHTVMIGAPAKVVYDLIADVTRWPYTFGPTVHAEVFETDGPTERLRLHAFANGDVRTWTSRRELDSANLHVKFEQERSAAPVKSMGGEWRIVPIADSATRVDLLHHFTTAQPEAVELVLKAVNNNSDAELAALKRAAELGDDYDKYVLSFSDSITIHATRKDVYEFLYRSDLWPQRLPHVARHDLT